MAVGAILYPGAMPPVSCLISPTVSWLTVLQARACRTRKLSMSAVCPSSRKRTTPRLFAKMGLGREFQNAYQVRNMKKTFRKNLKENDLYRACLPKISIVVFSTIFLSQNFITVTLMIADVRCLSQFQKTHYSTPVCKNGTWS